MPLKHKSIIMFFFHLRPLIREANKRKGQQEPGEAEVDAPAKKRKGKAKAKAKAKK